MNDLHSLELRILALENAQRTALDDSGSLAVPGTFEKPLHPFEVYTAGSKLCVWPGQHHWWNQLVQQIQTTSLYEDGTNSWALSACTIYVKRIYNDADDTATVTLEHTTDDASTVRAGITPKEFRWVIATFAASTGEGINQRHCAGDIVESRTS